MGQGKRVLIIDDSEHLRTVLKLTLQYSGYEVTEAGDGAAGLKLAAEGAFDLILCDIEMPVMNGVEFVRRRREAAGPETPIVMLTAAEDGELARKALAAGATAVLRKPFEPIALLEEIGKFVREVPEERT